MSFSFEDAAEFLPKYLNPADREELFRELKSFSKGMSYFVRLNDPDPLQGDGWSDVDFFDLDSHVKRSISVAVISNTCDISPQNARQIPARVCISPIIKLTKLVNLFRDNNVAEQTIEQKLREIRAQEITNIFYLPKGGNLADECVVFLDNVQSPLASAFNKGDSKRRLYTLSQAGFWLFLLKLSIHFCRAHEGVRRKLASAN